MSDWCPIIRRPTSSPTKLAISSKDLSYAERCAALELSSLLYYRRAAGDGIEIYERMPGTYAVYAEYIKAFASVGKHSILAMILQPLVSDFWPNLCMIG